MADSVVAEGWAEEPDGYYNIERMLKRVLTGKGQVLLEPLVHGAGHESGRRAGTESATLAAALGEACVLACNLAPMTHVQALRDHFWRALNHRFGTRRQSGVWGKSVPVRVDVGGCRYLKQKK